MRCKTVRNLLGRSIRDELAPRIQTRVAAHVRRCPECRRAVAAQERLESLLASVPQPPAVPDGFGDRVLAAARQRSAAQRPVPGGIWRRHWASPTSAMKRTAVQTLALAGGLVLGLLMGQQTWRSAQSWKSPPDVLPDPTAVYELDYLADAPAGSLAQSFLSLTDGRNHNGT